MTNFKKLSNYTDEKISELLKLNGAFFCFSQKQFEESKKENIIYKNLQGGLICPKENAETLNNKIDEIYTNALHEQVKEFSPQRIIQYQYFNHETQITGDIENIKNILSEYINLYPNLFTNELIQKTCNGCFEEAVKNDWF